MDAQNTSLGNAEKGGFLVILIGKFGQDRWKQWKWNGNLLRDLVFAP
jgi:hypothetical protein